jgi:nucleotide-binding universal stress UspA family protein
MFKRILVAVDGSPASSAGLKAAIDLARDQQATVVALHVIDDSVLPVNFEGVAYPRTYVDSYFAAQEQYGRKLVERAVVSALRSNVKLEPAVVRSQSRTVADVIVAQARKLKADGIVIGTHGRRGLARVLMGSDAEEVVRIATVPVLLVRGAYRSQRKARARAPTTSPRAGGTRVRSPSAATPA